MGLKSSNILPPPWLAFRAIERYSIGWRMGYGEDYLYKFMDWFDQLSDQDRSEYQSLFPEPITWSGWYQDKDEMQVLEHGDYVISAWQESGQPKYHRKWLEQKFAAKSKVNMCMFWGHHSNKEFITKACLSQWFQAKFYGDGHHYTCMEQFMMAHKAALFGDHECKEQILQSSDPKHIKALGRLVKGFNEAIWDQFKYSIVVNGNWYKFSQNQALREFLMSTGDSILVEASPADKIWGIGLASDHEHAKNPLMWQGQNLLGFALMEVRDELNRVNAHESLCNWNNLEHS